MRKCKKCGKIWVSQSEVCIDCGSKDIIYDYKEEKNDN